MPRRVTTPRNAALNAGLCELRHIVYQHHLIITYIWENSKPPFGPFPDLFTIYDYEDLKSYYRNT